MVSSLAISVLGFCLLHLCFANEDPSYCLDREDGLYPDPDDCAGWYMCTDGQTEHNTCTFGQLYNHASGTCENEAVCNIVCPSVYLPHGKVETTGVKPFDTVKHTCDEGYLLIDGTAVGTCTSTGVWTGNRRRCWPGPKPTITDEYSQYPGYKYTRRILHDLTNVKSGNQCASMCRNLPTCKSANYQRLTRSCNLMDAVPAFLPDHLEVHDDFEYIELK